MEEDEEEDQHQYVPSQPMAWMKEEPVNYNERLVPSVNESGDQSSENFKSETSIRIKSEEDTEDDIPLVGSVVIQYRVIITIYTVYAIYKTHLRPQH